MSESKARELSQLADELIIDASGNATFAGDVAAANLSTTGNITVGGLVDGRDIAADGTKLDAVESGAEANPTPSEILTDLLTVDGAGSGLDADTLDGKQLATIETEYQSYADTAVSNLVAAAPATLDTLNELAAALGDDPNFATTVTNSIATKLSLSGGTMTGDITFNSTQLFDGRDVSADGAVIDSLGTAATQDVGTSAGNVVQLDGSARLPAVDGSQLTGIEGVPSGIIAMWSGSIASIPSGWVLCDGLNGTPNLTGRFVVHADADTAGTYNVGATGGSNSVTLTEAQIPGHTHTISGNTSTTGAHTHTLSGNTSNSGNHTHNGSTSNTGSHSHGVSAQNIDFNSRGYNVFFGGNGPDSGIDIATTNTGAHSHNFTTAGGGDHSHTLSGNAASAGDHSHTISATASSTGGGGSHENRPPYYALAYIMKT